MANLETRVTLLEPGQPSDLGTARGYGVQNCGWGAAGGDQPEGISLTCSYLSPYVLPEVLPERFARNCPTEV